MTKTKEKEVETKEVETPKKETKDSDAKKEYRKLIEAYKAQSPVKYLLKKEALEKKLKTL